VAIKLIGGARPRLRDLEHDVPLARGDCLVRPAQTLGRIVRIKSTPAHDMGVVQADTQQEAIEKACELYNITDPHQRSRVMAQRLS
jgi:hypothetical protein